MIFHSFLDMMDITYVNSVGNILRNPKVTAINSCIEVDITGQVVSDSIGNRMYSGISQSFPVFSVVINRFLFNHTSCTQSLVAVFKLCYVS